MAHSHRVLLLSLAAFLLAAALLPRSAHAGDAPPGVLDPSEEITPEELASIPEPVPAAPRAAAPTQPASKPPGMPSEPLSSGERGTALPPNVPLASPPEPPPAAIGGPWIWRVQILATPDRALAERVAREAAERLGTTSRVDAEPLLHKVRLGGFASEADAQILKARAVEMGYPGAFRVKIHAAATDE
ncbi:MAG: SPOR domain-containing protein [Candidatus Eisenbacteria bacterium]